MVDIIYYHCNSQQAKYSLSLTIRQIIRDPSGVIQFERLSSRPQSPSSIVTPKTKSAEHPFQRTLQSVYISFLTSARAIARNSGSHIIIRQINSNTTAGKAHCVDNICSTQFPRTAYTVLKKIAQKSSNQEYLSYRALT